MIEGQYYGPEFWSLYIPIAGSIIYFLVGFYFGHRAYPHLERAMNVAELSASFVRNSPEAKAVAHRRKIMLVTVGAIVVFWPLFALVVAPLSFKSVRDRIGQ